MKDCMFVPWSEKDNPNYECNNWKPAVYTVQSLGAYPSEVLCRAKVCADHLASACAVMSDHYGPLVVILEDEERTTKDGKPWFL